MQEKIHADDEGQLAIYDHTAGYVESIGDNPAALSSVMFIFVVFGFLLLLINIAGRRWQAEGRYDDLET